LIQRGIISFAFRAFPGPRWVNLEKKFVMVSLGICQRVKESNKIRGSVREKIFFRVVSHNAEHIFRIFNSKYLSEIAKEIEILLNYHSVGPKVEFEAKKRRSKIS